MNMPLQVWLAYKYSYTHILHAPVRVHSSCQFKGRYSMTWDARIYAVELNGSDPIWN